MAPAGGTLALSCPVRLPLSRPEKTSEREYSSRDAQTGLGPLALGSRAARGADPPPMGDETAGPLPLPAPPQGKPLSRGVMPVQGASLPGDFTGPGRFPRRAAAGAGRARGGGTARRGPVLRGRGPGDAPRTASSGRRERGRGAWASAGVTRGNPEGCQFLERKSTTTTTTIIKLSL